MLFLELPPWFSGKDSACSAGDRGSIPGSRRSPGGRHSNPFQYSSLENPKDRGAWGPTAHRVAKSQMMEETEHTCIVSLLSHCQEMTKSGPRFTSEEG